MNNMLPEEVDIRPLMAKGYSPVYCNGAITALINKKPYAFNAKDEVVLKQSLLKWLNKNKPEWAQIEQDLVVTKHTQYQYSYIILYDPVDVYKTEIIGADGKMIKLFIRYDGTKIMTPYDVIDWSTCSDNSNK